MAESFTLKLLDGEGFNVLYRVALILGPVGRSIHVNCVEAFCFPTGLKGFLHLFKY